MRGFALCGIAFVNVPALWRLPFEAGRDKSVQEFFNLFGQQRFFPFFFPALRHRVRADVDRGAHPRGGRCDDGRDVYGDVSSSFSLAYAHQFNNAPISSPT